MGVSNFFAFLKNCSCEPPPDIFRLCSLSNGSNAMPLTRSNDLIHLSPLVNGTGIFDNSSWHAILMLLIIALL